MATLSLARPDDLANPASAAFKIGDDSSTGNSSCSAIIDKIMAIRPHGNLRSARLFFGRGENRPYYFEPDVDLATTRACHNLSFFFPNYMAFTAAVFTAPLLIKYGIILLAMFFVAYVVLIFSSCLFGIQTAQMKEWISMVIGVYLFWDFCFVALPDFWRFFWDLLCPALFFIFVHSVLRDTSALSATEHKQTDNGGVDDDKPAAAGGEYEGLLTDSANEV